MKTTCEPSRKFHGLIFVTAEIHKKWKGIESRRFSTLTEMPVFCNFNINMIKAQHVSEVQKTMSFSISFPYLLRGFQHNILMSISIQCKQCSAYLNHKSCSVFLAPPYMVVVIQWGTTVKCHHPVFGFLPIFLYFVLVLVPLLDVSCHFNYNVAGTQQWMAFCCVCLNWMSRGIRGLSQDFSGIGIVFTWF